MIKFPRQLRAAILSFLLAVPALSKTPDPYFHAPAITFTYTGQGRATMTDTAGFTRYSYDYADRQSGYSGPYGSVSYTYDLAENLTQIFASQYNVNYAYDALNRLSTVQESNTGTTSYAYDAVGNLQSVTYPNGVVHSYAYDTRNRLTNLGVTGTVNGAPGAIASYAYTLDDSGHRTTVMELSGRTVNYGYDNLYRLTNETIASDPNAMNGAVSYVYDPVGNRQQKTSTLPGYPGGLLNYNANDQLASDAYDANGNTTGSGTNTGANGYAYDFENHLIQQGAITFGYDGDGNRVSKSVGGSSRSYLNAAINPTGYVQVLQENFNGGTGGNYELNHNFVYGLELINERRYYLQNNGAIYQTFYYDYDGHGSVRALTDTIGTVTDTYDYDAFGNLIHSTGTTPNNYLFAAEQFDPDLNLYYNRARYLNTSTGRFWSMDSDEGRDLEPLSLHKYLYASASPVDRVDPSGNDDIAEVSAAEGIGEELDTQVSPAQALRAEANVKVADIYFVFGLGNFGGGGKFAGFIPVPHAYVYANLKGVNEGERIDVGIFDRSNMVKSLITTVPGFVQIEKTDLGSVQRDSLFMKSWASLSTLELPLWRAGIPALATEISTGVQSLFPPSAFSTLGVPYSVLGEGQLNCITFSLAAVGLAKIFEKAPI